MSHRQEILMREPGLDISDLVSHFRILQNAVEWMKVRANAGHPLLLITPTVSVELSHSTQFQRND